MIREKKEKCANLFRYIALFPHEDTAGDLRRLQTALFSRGVPFSRALPPFVPLFLTREPAQKEDLKHLAKELGALRDGDKGFRFRQSLDAQSPFTEGPSFWGLRLESPEWQLGSPLCPAPSSELCLCAHPAILTLAIRSAVDHVEEAKPITLPQVILRSAYLSNIAVCITEEGDQIEWEAGESIWLPSPRQELQK